MQIFRMSFKNPRCGDFGVRANEIDAYLTPDGQLFASFLAELCDFAFFAFGALRFADASSVQKKVVMGI